MADICVIYAREDHPFVTELVSRLTTTGWTVWWDDRIHQGDFTKHIEEALLAARSVIPVWSKNSITKDWVRDEARFAKEAKKPLYPIRLDKTHLPLGFGQLHTIDIPESKADEGLHRLINALKTGIGPPLPRWDGKRPATIEANNKKVQFPCFFRSVSSFETQLRPDAAIRALELQGAEAILASAYDIIHTPRGRRLTPGLRRLMKADRFVVLDSGNYEAYRKKDTGWKRRLFVRAVQLASADYAFCFDNLKPYKNVRRIVSQIVQGVKSDQEDCEWENILPIVHIPINKGQFATEMLPELVCSISQELHPVLIGVPERELGSGIIEKAKVVAMARSHLDRLGYYQPLHLLGTGNPISLAIFSAAGADSFDGLEWCRTAADHENGRLYHFQQYDFFKYQTRLASSTIVRAAVDDEKVSFNAKVAFHNLDFLSVWMGDIRRHVHAGTIDRFLASTLPKGAFDDLAKGLPEVFE